MLFCALLSIIKWDWGTFFSKIGKWLTTTIKSTKVTCYNSWLKPWKETKYANELIPLRSYEKGFAFLLKKALKISRMIL